MHKHRRRSRERSLSRHAQPGAAPGIVVAQDGSSPTSVTAVSFGPDDIEVFEDAALPEVIALSGKRPVLWIHVEGTRDTALICQLGEAFSLHGLALEDAVTHHQHVKVEEYSNHLFLVSRLVPTSRQRETRQLNIFLTDKVVITMTDEPSDLTSALRPRLNDPHSNLRRKGCDFLAYAILDIAIDHYFPLLEDFGGRLDDLEDRITDHPPRDIIHEVHDIRVELREMRRVVWQQREAINTLLRSENRLIKEETRTYLRDCHDHTIQLVELLEVDHETCSDLRDVYLSAISNRMNEIMMVLTIIATIFMPLGFIAGLYGMNFNTQNSPFNMPELNWYLGYRFGQSSAIARQAGLRAEPIILSTMA